MSMQFIHSAKLTEVVVEDSENDFIGYVTLSHINGDPKSNMGDTKFMYFKGYHFIQTQEHPEKHLKFKENEFKSDIEYSFQCCTLRIPKELEFQALEPIDHTTPLSSTNFKFISPSPQKSYFGLAILNIHDPNSIDDNLIKGAYLENGNHYDTTPYFEGQQYQQAFSILSAEEKTKHGKFGCKSSVLFDKNKLPIFLWDATEGVYSHDSSDTPEKVYLHLAMGTDLTLGYCVASESSMDRIRDFINKCLTQAPEGKSLGIAVEAPLYLEVAKFEDNFGIHLISFYEGGWHINFFDQKKYLS